MRAVCPACSAEYEVPDRLIGAGRRLRCARCDHDWMVHLPPPEPAAAPSPEDPPAPPTPMAPEPMARPSRPAAPAARPAARRSPLLWLAWAASVALVVGGAVAVALFRPELTEAWPPVARLYLLVAG